MTATSADLEISLFRRDAGSLSDGAGVSYGIELRYGDPESEADKRLDGVAPVIFDPVKLRAARPGSRRLRAIPGGPTPRRACRTGFLRPGDGGGPGSEPPAAHPTGH